MKISLFSILTLAAASFAMPSMAQQTVYLNKGEQKVETVDLGQIGRASCRERVFVHV